MDASRAGIDNEVANFEEDEINDDKIMDYKVHPIANMIKESIKLSNCGNYHYFDKQNILLKQNTVSSLNMRALFFSEGLVFLRRLVVPK